MANYKDGVGNYKGGGGVTLATELDQITSDFTTTSDSPVDITGMAITISNTSGGYAMIYYVGNTENSTIDLQVVVSLEDDGTVILHNYDENVSDAAKLMSISGSYVLALNGSVMKLQLSEFGGGTAKFRGHSSDKYNLFQTMEIS